MKIFAYLFSDPTWERPPDPQIWGWEVDGIYQDWDQRRPQLQALLRECQEQPGQPAYLLVRRLEELGSSLAQVGDRLQQLETLGVRVVALDQDYGATATGGESEDAAAPAWGGKQWQLLQLLEAIEASQRQRRIRQGHARNRLKTLPPPGKAPYGYRRGKDRYVIDRSAAPVVKDFFEHFLLYGSLREAVRYLEKKHGKRISVSTGRRWLTNRVYRGDLLYQGQQVITGTHGPIVSRQEAAQVDRLLRRNRLLAPRTASAPRSLAGLVSCAACQSSMTIVRVTARNRPQEYLYLRPRTCPRQPKCRAIAYQEVLDQTITQICTELPLAVAGINQPEMNRAKTHLETAIASKQQILQRLPELVAEEILDPATAQLRAYQVQTEISELLDQLAQLPPVNLREIVQAVAIPPFWQDLSEPERRFFFREFIRQIQIQRGAEGWSLKLIFIFS